MDKINVLVTNSQGGREERMQLPIISDMRRSKGYRNTYLFFFFSKRVKQHESLAVKLQWEIVKTWRDCKEGQV